MHSMIANPQTEELSATPSSGQFQPLVTANYPTAMAMVAAEAVTIPVEEQLRRAAEKVENDFSKIKTKIHRYPAIFRSLISKDDRYFIPRVVAIGPYHHGALHLQEVEEVKRAAAYYFCRESGHSVEEVYQKILSVAADARSCYIDDAVASIGDGDFSAMMFHDGCFLLQFIIRTTDDIAPSLESWFFLNTESMGRDIIFLENQLPWLVLDALMNFRSVPMGRFISQKGWNFEARPDFGKKPFVLDESYTPAHLLGLLRYCQSGLIEGYSGSIGLNLPDGITSMSQSSSAIELAEVGIKLVANKTTQFKDIGLRKTLLQGELFLPPLVMNDQNASWFINMVALEASAATNVTTSREDYTVTSYVYLLATLMNREEDVHELRVKGILHGDFSNKRTLVFFNNLVELMPTPINYGILLADIETYKQKRWIWIPIYKFIYNNFKSIVTILSVVGVLVGIFKSLLSIKQHQQ